MNIAELFVRISGDVAPLQKSMNDAQRTVVRSTQAIQTQVTRTSASTSQTITRLGNAFGTLASQSLGVPPALLRVGSVLSTFAAGGVVTAGVVGGLALMGAKWRDLTDAVEDHEKALAATEKRLQGLVEKGAFGGQLQLFQDRIDAATAAGALRRRIAPLAAERAGLQAAPTNALEAISRQLLGAQGVAQRIAEIDKELGPLQAELTGWERRLEAVDRALQGALPQLDELTVTVTRLGAAVGALAVPERADIEAARAAAEANRKVIEAHRAFLANLPTSTTTPTARPTGVAGTDIVAVNNFREAVDAFKGGVEQMVRGAFSAEGLADIGSNLASNAIGFAAGKIFGAVANAFDDSARRLEAALEQNTRALRAGSDFLASRLSGAGQVETAQQILTAIQETINRLGVREGVTIGGELGAGTQIPVLTFIQELKKLGLSFQAAQDVAELLGISISTLNDDILQQFKNQLENAVGGLTDLEEQTESFTETLRNVPEIWSAALGRFRATGMGSPGLGSVDLRGPRNTFTGPINVYGVQNVAELTRQIETEVQRRGARAGAPVIRDAARRRSS